MTISDFQLMPVVRGVSVAVPNAAQVTGAATGQQALAATGPFSISLQLTPPNDLNLGQAPAAYGFLQIASLVVYTQANATATLVRGIASARIPGLIELSSVGFSESSAGAFLAQAILIERQIWTTSPLALEISGNVLIAGGGTCVIYVSVLYGWQYQVAVEVASKEPCGCSH